MKYLIGTRGSQLSVAQTNWVVSELKKKNPDSDYEIKTITTKGDTDARPLFTINQKGIFEKEIDKAVAEKQVDFAVHSLKDVPSLLPDDLILGCVPPREPFNDIFISKNGDTLDTIPEGALIGTSSLRRAVQVSRKRPDLQVKTIRGNVETRIKKVQDGIFDGIVLAQAGINRLGVDVKHTPLSIIDFPPSPGQGALGIVCRKNDTQTISMLQKIQDDDSRMEVESERALSEFVDSGCRFPVGAFAKVNGESLDLTVIAYSIDGKQALIVKKSGQKSNSYQIGKEAADELQQKGVNDLAKDWRAKLDEWNKT
ncbi:MAG: hydroxymethylbilane synthase [Nitrososphaeria archaeon]|nr:hydroxymethylbilane synthase [Nitrososphaeria archaeon]NDB50961.1 hydroxymethylbilane synthase [Nitrosopumilaceae archaeon]NDB87315.1 hydroxymethylbilane synthase [Nitrososphaerota archaeon]NDB45843.1 hydroxymethylbilane synthase [Nitrososphaeria archaeon]NDB89213.1 hydroxymethylbilane synthase [Nitrososphaerota archaeon]